MRPVKRNCRLTNSGSAGTIRDRAGADGNVPAVATAVLVRSRDAKPGGRKGCKTAGIGLSMRAREVLFAPGTIAAKKSGFRRLGAGPRTAGHQTRHGSVRSRLQAALGLFRSLAFSAAGTDTAGSGPGVSLDRWWSADTARWLVFAASVGLRPGTRGCSIELGDGWDERASRNP